MEIRVKTAPHTVWVLPMGQLDLLTASELGARIQQLTATGVKHVIIDLRGVSFIDSSGVRLLTFLAGQAQRDRWQLSLMQGPRAVRRVFALTDTLNQLPFTSSTTLPGE